MHTNEGVEGRGGQGREEGGEGRGMSVRLLIRVFVFHYWVKSRESKGNRGREGENRASRTVDWLGQRFLEDGHPPVRWLGLKHTHTGGHEE